MYPEFCRYDRNLGLSDGPWLCEDDGGHLAFISEEMKKQYFRKVPHSMVAMRRTKR